MGRTRRHEPQEIDDYAPPRSFAERIRAERPDWPPLPEGAIIAHHDNIAGVRVVKDADKRWAAYQFDNNKPPTRAEKDYMEAVLEEDPDRVKASYEDPHSHKLWKRYSGGEHGANVIDMMQRMDALAEGRRASMGVGI